ncbi:MAG: DUF5362 family protein [Fidelibacterota bacterium]
MNETEQTPSLPKIDRFVIPETELESLTALATWSQRLGVFLIVLGVIYILTIFFYAFPTVIAGIFFIAMGTRLTAAAKEMTVASEELDGEALGSALRLMKTFFIQNLVFYSLVIVFMIVVVIAMLAFAPAFQELMEGNL